MLRALSVVIVLTMLLAAGRAHADEAESRGNTALALSVGASLAGFAALGAGIHAEDPTLIGIGAGSILFLPSLGHWTLGDADLKGLGIRAGGGALIGAGAFALFLAIEEDENSSDGDSGSGKALAGVGLIAVGSIAVLAGVGHDWFTVRDLANVRFAPVAAPGLAGLSMSGSF